MKRSRQASAAWSSFTKDGPTGTTCNICKKSVSRGKTSAACSSTPLWSHLSSCHPKEHAEAVKQRSKDDETAKARKVEVEKSKQMYCAGTPKMKEFLDRNQKYRPDHPEQLELEKLNTIWLADAVLPYAAVDNIW